MRVETYSSFAYAVAPRAFEYAGATQRVCEIMRVWRTPAQIHFYIRDEQEKFFELTYKEMQDQWTIRAFGEMCPSRTINTE